jgi:hypothetical protein
MTDSNQHELAPEDANRLVEAYNVLTCPPAKVVGYSVDPTYFSLLMHGAVRSRVLDSPGLEEIAPLFPGLDTSLFNAVAIRQVLVNRTHSKFWQVGEALAAVLLEFHHGYRFPWPPSRDARETHGSPTGPDLVGFRDSEGGPFLAFGEIKTSDDGDVPPRVATNNKDGLIKQVKDLLGDSERRSQLIKYLAFHALGSVWQSDFQRATYAYFSLSNQHYCVIGALVRDIVANQADLMPHSASLVDACRDGASLEMYAWYLPCDSVSRLPDLLGPTTQGETNADA